MPVICVFDIINQSGVNGTGLALLLALRSVLPLLPSVSVSRGTLLSLERREGTSGVTDLESPPGLFTLDIDPAGFRRFSEMGLCLRGVWPSLSKI
jgi:hypothetical protein